MGVNNLTIIGNLGSDPETREMASGTKVAKLRVAVNEWRNNEKKTTWFDAVAFNGRAEYILKTCQKGSKVYLEGPWSYEQMDLNTSKWEMIINKVIVLEGRKENAD
mgnify:CR=1 FL=1